VKVKYLCLSFLMCCLILPITAQDKEQDTAVEAVEVTKEDKMQDSTSDFRKIVQDAKSKVFPAVVYIRVKTETHDRGKKVQYEISGSGFIVSKKGEVVTNWHVVDKAVEIRCLLFDGRRFDAKVIGTDKDTDLALIKLELPDDKQDLPTAEIGDSSKLVEGDFVMTMGAPFGMSRSVALGIISCTERYLEGNSEYSLWLQTDAAINPGNSGGPLVNTQGKVIGVNTLGITDGDNTGFSVPTGTIKHVIEQVRKHGEVQWSYTGLKIQPLSDFNKNIYFDFDDGVMVKGSDPDSPAAKAGLLPNDRIMAINGKKVTVKTEESLPMLRRLLGTLPEGKESLIDIKRGKKDIKIKITPRKKGKVEGEEKDYPRWDFTAKAINQFHNPDLYHYSKTGVYLFGLKREGNAIRSNLRSGDIIQEVGGEKIVSLEDLQTAHEKALSNIDKEHKLLFRVLRNGEKMQMVLDFKRDFERE
jgi:serine protease Do